jgi:hypothetical protein
MDAGASWGNLTAAIFIFMERGSGSGGSVKKSTGLGFEMPKRQGSTAERAKITIENKHQMPLGRSCSTAERPPDELRDNSQVSTEVRRFARGIQRRVRKA